MVGVEVEGLLIWLARLMIDGGAWDVDDEWEEEDEASEVV